MTTGSTGPGGARTVSARTRLLWCGAIAVVAGAATLLLGGGPFALAAGWGAGSLVFLVWVWRTILPMDAEATRAHALVEDDTRGGAQAAVLLSAVASLAALVVMLVVASTADSPVRELLASAGLLTVMLSWTVVHTVFTLRYTHLYHVGEPGGVDFNQSEPPRYRDFAYLAFTIGMTYQVSDTSLTKTDIRWTVLGQALLSFLFGAFVLATTINLVAGLASTH